MYRLIRPLLFRLDAETAHGAAFGVADAVDRVAGGLIRSVLDYEHAALEQTVWGVRFANPVGLAAGADKNGDYGRLWEHLGMGFTEIGSITARASAGNPRPRAFRLPEDRALVNRMGLNNQGARAVAGKLASWEESVGIPVGVNIAKTHDPAILGSKAVVDFVTSFRLLAPRAAYVALNISCPNTAEGKTFEEPEALDGLLDAIMKEKADLYVDVPVLVKWSPPPPGEFPEAQLQELLTICESHGVDGHVATNTASDREGLKTRPYRLEHIGEGGLSGPPLADRSERLVRFLYRRLEGRRPIVGVGGIDSASQAYRRIRSGASLVQLYTGLVYEGPGLVRRIKKGLVSLMARDGFDRISEAVGADV